MSDSKFEPRILGILCTWCSYSGADSAGQSAYRVPAQRRGGPRDVQRPRRPHASSSPRSPTAPTACSSAAATPATATTSTATARPLAAWPCSPAMLGQLGIEPERVRLEWISASEGNRYAELVAEMTEQVRALGPLSWNASAKRRRCSRGQAQARHVLRRRMRRLRHLAPRGPRAPARHRGRGRHRVLARGDRLQVRRRRGACPTATSTSASSTARSATPRTPTSPSCCGAKSKVLVAYGACSSFGGVPGLGEPLPGPRRHRPRVHHAVHRRARRPAPLGERHPRRRLLRRTARDHRRRHRRSPTSCASTTRSPAARLRPTACGRSCQAIVAGELPGIARDRRAPAPSRSATTAGSRSTARASASSCARTRSSPRTSAACSSRASCAWARPPAPAAAASAPTRSCRAAAASAPPATRSTRAPRWSRCSARSSTREDEARHPRDDRTGRRPGRHLLRLHARDLGSGPSANRRSRRGGALVTRISIDPITRLEGHGRIDLFLGERGHVDEAYLVIPELRGFEKFLEGRPVEEMPQITSRICGVCPEAHHAAAAKAADAVYNAADPGGRRGHPAPAVQRLHGRRPRDALLRARRPGLHRRPRRARRRAQHHRRHQQGRPRARRQGHPHAQGGATRSPRFSAGAGSTRSTWCRAASRKPRLGGVGGASARDRRATWSSSRRSRSRSSTRSCSRTSGSRRWSSPRRTTTRPRYLALVNKDNQPDAYDGDIRIVDADGHELVRYAPGRLPRPHLRGDRAVELPEDAVPQEASAGTACPTRPRATSCAPARSGR